MSLAFVERASWILNFVFRRQKSVQEATIVCKTLEDGHSRVLLYYY